MRQPRHVLLAALILSSGIALNPGRAVSQSSPPPPTPGAVTIPSPPALAAKDIQGLDVFGSDGQQVGKIAKVDAVADGTVRDVEIRSGGFLGFFSKTYVVPGDKLTKKGARVELSMTSQQAKQFIK